MLVYYANHSVGNSDFTLTAYPEVEEQLLKLIDVNKDNAIDAQDAYLILMYYAMESVGEHPVWDEIAAR